MGGASFRPLSRGPFFDLLLFQKWRKLARSFRPLSRGPFFDMRKQLDTIMALLFSSPFSGTFFRWACIQKSMARLKGFRPLSRGPFFDSVPAKPQPVCSRKRIRGGDGGIASSGTLLRR